MNALVKSHDGSLHGRIQSFRACRLADPEGADAPTGGTKAKPDTSAPPTVELAVPASETDILKAEIAALEAKLKEADATLEETTKASFEEGRKAGLKEADKMERERIELLDEALKVASERVAEAWASTQSLSLAIAGNAIGKVLGEETAQRQAVESCIKQQLRAVRPEVVTRLRVSAYDFPDADAVAPISNMHRLQVERDASLEPGACIFDLSLGRLDASIGKQRQAILDQLDEIASEAASS